MAASTTATAEVNPYPARFDVIRPERSNRLTVFFRLFLVIPALILVRLVTMAAGLLVLAVVLMLLFRNRYPRPWFEWLLYTRQYTARVTAYAFLLTDRYPSTTDMQDVVAEADLEEGRLSRALPLIKWLLALPHLVILGVLGLVAGLVAVIAWFAILVTGKYPKGLHDFVVGYQRWTWRVYAYSSLLSTDRYPPFSLK